MQHVKRAAMAAYDGCAIRNPGARGNGAGCRGVVRDINGAGDGCPHRRPAATRSSSTTKPSCCRRSTRSNHSGYPPVRLRSQDARDSESRQALRGTSMLAIRRIQRQPAPLLQQRIDGIPDMQCFHWGSANSVTKKAHRPVDETRVSFYSLKLVRKRARRALARLS